MVDQCCYVKAVMYYSGRFSLRRWPAIVWLVTQAVLRRVSVWTRLDLKLYWLPCIRLQFKWETEFGLYRNKKNYIPIAPYFRNVELFFQILLDLGMVKSTRLPVIYFRYRCQFVLYFYFISMLLVYKVYVRILQNIIC